jgi:hypothetical protein
VGTLTEAGPDHVTVATRRGTVRIEAGEIAIAHLISRPEEA